MLPPLLLLPALLQSSAAGATTVRIAATIRIILAPIAPREAHHGGPAPDVGIMGLMCLV